MLNRNLMTLNLHCLVEENLPDKQQRIADKIAELDVDIVFLQEVAQTANTPLVFDTIKIDNYSYTLQQMLFVKGLHYHLYFLPIKASFGRFDEGLAILSKEELEVVDTRYISKTKDYQDWKSRKIFVTKSKQSDLYFASTHFGWSDGFEVFEEQVDLAFSALPQNSVFVLAGDFNVKPDTPEFQYLLDKGVYDLFKGSNYETHPTHKDNMDVHIGGTRIDYLVSNSKLVTSNHQILFSDNPVSDHFGLFVTITI